MKYYTTKNGHEKLNNKITELIHRLNILRKEKSAAYTRDGDGTHDNPHYQHLKNQEGTLLIRIKGISDIMSRLEIININNRDIYVVRIGSIITCSIFDSANKTTTVKTLEIVGYFEDSPEENRVSYLSPVGKSLLGLSEDESVDITLQNKTLTLTILFFHEEFPSDGK